MKYRRDIDGLRCLAIVPVVLYHAGARHFPGGFVGVDIFFVISGFLITSIIRHEIGEDRFTIASFYERRCRRILPALITVISVCFVVGYFVMLPGQYADFASSAMAAFLFVSNGFFWRQTGYFAPVAEWMPLLNTWSLAVEEQYYVLFPLFMLMVRRWRASRQLAVIGILFGGSFLLSVYGAQHHPSAAFYLTPFRAWELLLGVLIAYWPAPTLASRWLRELGSLVGLLMLLVPVAVYDSQTLFPGFFAAVPCLGTALLLVLGQTGSSLVKSALENRVPVSIGLISYSLYLWHWPLFVFMRLRFAQMELSPALATLGTIISFLIAGASWHFVETPFRRKGFLNRRRIFKYAGISVVLALSIAVAVYVSGGMPGRVSPEVIAFERATEDINPSGALCRALVNEPSCHSGGDDTDAVSFALWGDSHAVAFWPALERAMSGSGKRGTILWLPGCPPLLGATRVNVLGVEECKEFRERTMEFLCEPDNSIDTVFLSARWSTPATGVLPERGHSFVEPIEDAESRELGPEENKRVFIRSLKRTIHELRAAGKSIVLIGEAPDVGWHVPVIRALSAQHGTDLPRPISQPEEAERHEFVQRALADLAQQEGVTFVQIWDLFCPEHCLTAVEGRAIYSDTHHLSSFGAREFLGPRLKQRFESIGLSVVSE